MAKKSINAQGTEISVLLNPDKNDYICLTDMARFKDMDRTNYVIQNWLRNRNTIEYLGVWEQLNNPGFKGIEFDAFKQESGLNSFTLTPKQWIEKTHAVGLISRPGRYGGTYAHKDIAFNFGMWLSPAFQLYVVREYQKLITNESSPLALQWDVKRLLSKSNYTIHTDAVKDYVVPSLGFTKAKEWIVYANEADMLNLALFGYTAKDWEEANTELKKKGFNMRDTATINQLIVLSNMESYNSELIKAGIGRKERFHLLHKMAKDQLSSLDKSNSEQRFRRLTDGNLPLIED